MSLPDDLPPIPPSRDPLLDDPLFAEIVGPEAVKQPGELPYAEAVEEPPADDLPIAKLAAVQPPSEPVPVARPKAQPVRPIPSFPSMMPKPPAETEPPKGQWFAACGVIGCLGILVIGSIALLAWIAITLLSEFGNKIGEKKPDPVVTQSSVRPGPIAPTVLVNDITFPLDGTFDAVGHGGGGRFLILRIPRLKELHVFDANKAQVVHRIKYGDGNALFAAGAAKLFVYTPSSGKIERFDLVTGQSEAEVVKPKAATIVDALAMGPGSDGPLYLLSARPGSQSQIHALDATTLDLLATHEFKEWTGRPDRRVFVRASSDGMVLGVAAIRGSVAIRFDEAKPRAIPLVPDFGANPMFAAPSPDGQYLFTPRGVFDANGKHLAGTGRKPFFTFPTAHGSGLFLSVDVENDRVEGFPKLHAAGSLGTSELVALGRGEVSGDIPANEIRDQIPANERVQLWPGAGLLAVLPISNAELELYKVDIQTELKDASRDFIAFASEPVLTARRGAEWSYTPQFWSRSKLKPSVRLVEPMVTVMGFKGDKLVWIPQGVEAVDVELEVTGAAGLTATQKFRVRVVE